MNESNIEVETEKEKVRDLLARDKLQTEENKSLRKTIMETVSTNLFVCLRFIFLCFQEEEILVLQSQVETEFTKLKENLDSEQKKALESESIIEDRDVKLSDSLVQIEVSINSII